MRQFPVSDPVNLILEWKLSFSKPSALLSKLNYFPYVFKMAAVKYGVGTLSVQRLT